MQASALAILLYFVFSTLAHAEEIGTVSVDVLPTGGKHQGIVLKAQTVDAVLSNQQGTVWADTKVWLRLHNPASKAITVPVSLPGPQLFPARLPLDLQILVDDAPVALTVSKGSSSAAETGSGLIRIPARGSVDVRLSYRQALFERDERDVYGYMLSGADQWAGNPESLRVTVEFMPPLTTDQLSSPVVPSPHQSDAHSLKWDWEGDWAKTRPSILLAFMTPAWWNEYGAARAAAARDDAGATEHIALAQHYRRLASLPSLPFEAEAAYHTRYYPSIIAELRLAIAASTSVSDTMQARTLLADVYRREADLAAPEAVAYYLQSAAEEIRLATGDDAATPDLNTFTADAYAKLAQSALERRLIEKGESGTASQLLNERFGPTAAVLPDAPRPLANQSLINVIHTAHRRTIGLTLEGSGNPEALSELVTETATALRGRSPIEIITDSNRLTLTLPFQDGAQLAQLQRTLAADLPAAPELALLGAVLSSAPVLRETATGPATSTWRFEERMDLTSAAARWYQFADRLTAAASAAAVTPELRQDSSGGVSQLQRALWAADASAWREMVRNSRVQYHMSIEDPEVSRTWEVPAGASRDLLVEVARWNVQRIRWVPLVAAVLVIGGAALLWRLG
jgi:hypothetical protein